MNATGLHRPGPAGQRLAVGASRAQRLDRHHALASAPAPRAPAAAAARAQRSPNRRSVAASASADKLEQQPAAAGAGGASAALSPLTAPGGNIEGPSTDLAVIFDRLSKVGAVQPACMLPPAGPGAPAPVGGPRALRRDGAGGACAARRLLGAPPSARLARKAA